MPNTPILAGSQVRLRPPAVEDAHALYTRIASDPEVTRYLSWRPHSGVAETRRVITTLFNVGDEQTWLVEVEGEVAGLCARRRPQPYAVEVGYCLARPWWGRGLMSEAVSLILTDVEPDPAVYRVTAYCHVDNAGSAGVMRRCGLALEGRLARYAVFPNISDEPQDVLLFGKAVR
ncbi:MULTISPECIES: GNAT family N-acetyltransferase [Mycobacterium]|uniref:GNAT family N-acetyltransferase n=1 Tax=Mycobacterium syngnathidarum TaxID=1908205 RepID=A0A1Q9WBC7_9MYCO|nr:MULTISPECIES: GNAT family N-acetyltransferase [Mycobacterium]MCG7610487.1 GNAT family N-acetyltransferase [Mycobacterium sp. CnD-18-1]OHT90723.1 GNAT family N-acetyltransferase [Mycobacterium syngnathidarum]OLT96094.1 GNAT family N-acetyltransferase [Mycobacterium syngnathidarum]